MEYVRECNSQCYNEGILQVELYSIATTNILGSCVGVGAEVLLLGVPTPTSSVVEYLMQIIHQALATAVVTTLEHLLNMIKWQVLTSATNWLQPAEPEPGFSFKCLGYNVVLCRLQVQT